MNLLTVNSSKAFLTAGIRMWLSLLPVRKSLTLMLLELMDQLLAMKLHMEHYAVLKSSIVYHVMFRLGNIFLSDLFRVKADIVFQ